MKATSRESYTTTRLCIPSSITFTLVCKTARWVFAFEQSFICKVSYCVTSIPSTFIDCCASLALLYITNSHLGLAPAVYLRRLLLPSSCSSSFPLQSLCLLQALHLLQALSLLLASRLSHPSCLLQSWIVLITQLNIQHQPMAIISLLRSGFSAYAISLQKTCIHGCGSILWLLESCITYKSSLSSPRLR